MSDEVPKEEAVLFKDVESILSSFKDSVSRAKDSHNIRLLALEINEIDYKNSARKTLTGYFKILLALQNLIVFCLVIIDFFSSKFNLSSITFSVLIGGTLTETYFVTKIIIHWVFGETHYKQKR